MLFIAEEFLECVEAGGPEVLVGGKPLMSGREWPWVQPADVGAATNLAANEACRLQCLDVFRGGGERHLERLG